MTDPLENPSRLFEEVHELTAVSLDGTATPVEMARFDRLLREDPQARRLYVRYVDISCNLRQWASHPLLETTESGKNAEMGAPPHSLFGFLGNLAPWGENLPGMRMFLWLFAGLVGILLGLPAILMILAALGILNRPAAQLVATTECRWTDPAAAISAGSHLSPGQKIDLSAGEAQIVFQRGAVVALHGPAALEVLSDNSARLSVGALTAKIENKEARGFAVQTPLLKVVDLGTEFGVLVCRDGAQEVHVFRGEVQAQAANSFRFNRDGRPDESSSPVVLRGNEAIRVEKQPGGDRLAMVRGPADRGPFGRRAEVAAGEDNRSSRFLRWKVFSNDLRNRRDVLAYYDFQPDEGGLGDLIRLRNRAATGPRFDAEIVGGEWAAGRFPGKRAMRFLRPGDGLRVDLHGRSEQISAVAWVRLEPSSGDFVMDLTSMLDDGRTTLHWCTLAGLGIDPNAPSMQSMRLERLRPEQTAPHWGMSAMAWDAAIGAGVSYFNGVRTKHLENAEVEIARTLSGTWQPTGFCTRQGRVDELILFNSALSAEEIRRMYECRGE